MAKNNSVQKTDEYVNKTGTDLEILQKLEKAYYESNGYNARRNIKKSMNWFRKRITKNYKNVRTARMFRDRDLWKNRVTIGKMYLVQYSAITPDLPVFDAYPLIIPFNSWKSEAGNQLVTCINLHYLSPALRMEAFRALLKFKTNDRYNKATKLKFTWQAIATLAQSKYFEHAVKNYRVDQFQSKFVEIPAQSFEICIFLPLARWKVGTQATAWKM